MAEDRIVKLTNISNTDLPAHQPGEEGKCQGFGCSGCQVPMWNRIEFPLKRGETIVVKENVGNHLMTTFRGRVKITAGPFDTTALLNSPEGFFEHDPVTGKFKPLAIKTGTSPRGSSQDAGTEGEDISDVKKRDRFLAKGGDLGGS